MALKVFEKIQGASPRFFSKAALVVTILPLWALWVYAYATLETLQSEVEALPRFYGDYLYKEHVRSRLEGVARMMTLFEVQGDEEIEGGRFEGLSHKEWERFDLFSGRKRRLLCWRGRDCASCIRPNRPMGRLYSWANRRAERPSFVH